MSFDAEHSLDLEINRLKVELQQALIAKEDAVKAERVACADIAHRVAEALIDQDHRLAKVALDIRDAIEKRGRP